MQTRCTTESLECNPMDSRRVTAHFNRGANTANGGILRIVAPVLTSMFFGNQTPETGDK
jgi:hypothetical protein